MTPGATGRTSDGVAIVMDRSDFPFLASSRATYLDSAAVCPSPQPVIQAMLDYFTRIPLNYGVGVAGPARDVVEAVDAARECVARLIGAEPAEVAFTRNTTEAISLVAHGLRWEAGDEVIVTDIEHQANLLPWFRMAQEQAVRVVMVRADDGFVVRPEAVRRALSGRTRLVAVTAVSNLFGTIQPLDAIAQEAHRAGALFLVDAAQALGRIPFDTQQIGCDFAAFCGRKSLLGPQGSAFLYQQGGQLLQPLHLGSRAAQLGPSGEIELLPPPGRYEAGIPDSSAIVGVGAAAAYVQRAGPEAIHGHIRYLAGRLADRVRQLPVRVHRAQEADRDAGILSLALPDGQEPAKAARALWQRHQIIVASGVLGSPLAVARLGGVPVLRVSVHAFNTEADVDAFAAALRDLLQ